MAMTGLKLHSPLMVNLAYMVIESQKTDLYVNVNAMYVTTGVLKMMVELAHHNHVIIHYVINSSNPKD